MNPTTQSEQQQLTLSPEAATTITTTTTAAATNSKLLTNELRYVPVAMMAVANNAVPLSEGFMPPATRHCPDSVTLPKTNVITDNNTYEHVLPTTSTNVTASGSTFVPTVYVITGAGTSNPQTSLIANSDQAYNGSATNATSINLLLSNNSSVVSAVGGSQFEGIDNGINALVLPAGKAVVSSKAAAVTGSIIIHNQSESTSPIEKSAGTTFPLINQDTFEQIIVGPKPGTLFKPQIMRQRAASQSQVPLQQSKSQLNISKPAAIANCNKSPSILSQPTKCKETNANSLATCMSSETLISSTTTLASVSILPKVAKSITSPVKKKFKSLKSNRNRIAAQYRTPSMVLPTPVLATSCLTQLDDTHKPAPDATAIFLENTANQVAKPIQLSLTDVSSKTSHLSQPPETSANSGSRHSSDDIAITFSTGNQCRKVPTTKPVVNYESKRVDKQFVNESSQLSMPLQQSTTEKQKSVLRSKSKQQRRFTDDIGLRAKRSKSINCPLPKKVKHQDTQVAERRHSTAANVVASKQPQQKLIQIMDAQMNTAEGVSLLKSISNDELINLLKESEENNLIEGIENGEPKVNGVFRLSNGCVDRVKKFMESDTENTEYVLSETMLCAGQVSQQPSTVPKIASNDGREVKLLKDDCTKKNQHTASIMIVEEPATQINLQEQFKDDENATAKQIEDEDTSISLVIDEDNVSVNKQNQIKKFIECKDAAPDTNTICISLIDDDDEEEEEAKKPREQPTIKTAEEDIELAIASNHIRLEDMETDDDKNNNKDFKYIGGSLIANGCENLLCEEVISISPSSVTSSNNSIQKAGLFTTPPKVRAKLKNAVSAKNVESEINSYSSMLDMLSMFNMLTWKERIGKAHGTSMRFELNEFNLLQIHERCPPRYRIDTHYERPIYERESVVPGGQQPADPLLYLCRRCNCHGPAANFLAPEFCSLDCLKRETTPPPVNHRRKRKRKDSVTAAQSQKQSESQNSVKNNFHWYTYLTGKFSNDAAPINLFLNPFPTGPNLFQVGMKLEAIDPENCSLFCVCTVCAIQGYRLKLSFDGYDRIYSFWVNADSMDIFPPGWCAKTNRVLQPPKGMDASKFNWTTYIAREGATPAYRYLFTHLNSSALPTNNPFKLGMHLEAEDLNDTGKLCVATVADVLGDRIRVHFDGWDNCYDYWVDISSPYIHPCGWHDGRQQLIVPPEFENYSFSWKEYIKQQGNAAAAHEGIFVARDPIEYKPNMKLEVVDPRNPSLIRPATVVGRKGHRIKLHMDCWSSEYCFWMEDDSPDLHPVGWCDATNHFLEPPPGYQMLPVKVPCSITGCRGIGNAKSVDLNTHDTRKSCPYAPENWRQKIEKSTRINSEDVVRHMMALPSSHKVNNRIQLKSMQTSRFTNEQQLLENVQAQANRSTRRASQLKLQRTHVPTPTSAPSLTFVDHDKFNCAAPLPMMHIDVNTPRQTPDLSNLQSPVSVSDSSSISTISSSPSSIASAQTALVPELQITKNFLVDYGPRLRQSYDLWQKNIVFDRKQIKRNPLHWSPAESCVYVQSILKCAKTAAYFVRDEIDGCALLLLQQSDLTDILGLKLGPAVKLYSHILQLRTLAVSEFGVSTIATATQ